MTGNEVFLSDGMDWNANELDAPRRDFNPGVYIFPSFLLLRKGYFVLFCPQTRSPFLDICLELNFYYNFVYDFLFLFVCFSQLHSVKFTRTCSIGLLEKLAISSALASLLSFTNLVLTKNDTIFVFAVFFRCYRMMFSLPIKMCVVFFSPKL